MKRSKKLKTTGGGGVLRCYNTVSHLIFFATLNKEQKSYLQFCRRLNGKMLVLGFLYSKSTTIVQQKMRKNQHVKQLCFLLNTTNTSTLKIVHSKSPVHGHDPKFLFPDRYKTVLSVYD